MMRSAGLAMLAVVFAMSTVYSAETTSITGKVADASGTPLEGVMVSAFDSEHRLSTSVFSQSDGSFNIDGLRYATYDVRARLLGQLDEWSEEIDAGESELTFAMHPATGEDLEMQTHGG